jgi:hypothetical protein
MTAIVAGAIANKPGNGGESWVRLSWALGMRKLGFDVHLVEQIDPLHCVAADGHNVPFEESSNLAYFRAVVERFGLARNATLICGDQSYGLRRSELQQLAAESELLLNISGHLALADVTQRVRKRVFVDIDPGFTQLWHAAGRARLAGHDFYFTIGEHIGTPSCTLPTGGIAWRPIRQPVVLEDWPVTPGADQARFTTIASWRGSYGPIESNGKRYGLKVHEFRKFMTLPAHTAGCFEIALDIHPADHADLADLQDNGWQLSDPRRVAADPDRFRAYVQASAAEFSVAQGIYVESECGWFSDRTVRYLASGRPALVQDTGFSRTLPVGEGLLAFRTLDEAAAGATDVVEHYERHARAARNVAEEFFDSDRVLGRMLEDIGVAP